jgi:hypothetical protein
MLSMGMSVSKFYMHVNVAFYKTMKIITFKGWISGSTSEYPV